MVKYAFLERKDTNTRNGVSLIVVTSPIPSHPNTTLIDVAIESVLKMNYPFSEMIISYDKDRKNTSSYKTYKKNMKSKYPQFKHLELDKHGHFIGTFHNALNHCKTKYFFLLQHDISLIGKFPIDECLKTSVPWNIIATHHFKPKDCEKDIPKPTHWFPIMKKTKDKNLLKTYGWSERIFLSKRDWMMDKLHEYYHKGKTTNFIESIFHKEFDKLWKRIQKITHFYDISTEPQYMKIYDKFWSEWKVYNLKSSIAYHSHLHGRTAKPKSTKGKRSKHSKSKKKITKRKTSRGGCGKGGGKKTQTSKKDKTLRNKYKKISSIDCAKKYPKSRDKTLKCLDQKVKDLKSLESEYPTEMKLLKKEIKDYEKAILSFMKEAAKCKKHMPDMNKVQKCAEEIAKKQGNIFKDNKELGQTYTNNMRDKLQRMIDHTQKVDLGELGKLNL
tara:strand:- start:122 stop:1450 length:1329 start_codon:yes stop_codon:yes gene_type:complete